MYIRRILVPFVMVISAYMQSYTVDGLSLMRREVATNQEGNLVIEPDRNIDDSNAEDSTNVDLLEDSLPGIEDEDSDNDLLLENREVTDSESDPGSKVIEPERHDDDSGVTDEGALPEDEILTNDDGNEDIDQIGTETQLENPPEDTEVDTSSTAQTSNDFSEVLRRRKRQALWRETRLSRDHHPLEVTLVEAIDDSNRRVKRTSYKSLHSTWPLHIPYVFDTAFKMGRAKEVRNVMDYLEEHLCLTFTLEDTFDSSNRNWFKEHGYDTNAYIKFLGDSSCFAYPGRGNDYGARPVSPCSNYMTMMHELMHALGGMHAQSFPERDRYITVHKSNIMKGMSHNYSPVEAERSKVTYKYFDSHSMLMYYPSDFSINGQETFNYVRPDMGTLYGTNSYQSILSEMTENYKCVERFCNATQIDCGIGYLGYIGKECKCVCPDGYDPDTNCESLINEAPPSGSWPDTPFTLYKAGSKCPTGFEEGLIPIHGIHSPKTTGEPITSSGYTLNLETCTRKASGKVDFKLLPKGSYCVVKPADIDCQEPFEEGSYTINTATSKETTGAVGDVTVDGTQLTIRFCCTRARNILVPIKLPISEPFRLLPYSTAKCQGVEGAWVTPGQIDIYNRGPTFTKIPFALKNSVLLRQMSCHYAPAKYGCSELVKLDANTKSFTVSSPGFGVQREGGRRCFYAIQAPEDSTVRISFDTFSLSPKDLFLLKRFHKWQRPFRIFDYMTPTQMISESNFMFVEYWSHTAENEDYKGVQLTFDLISPENSCYDEDTNGGDYAGDKDITENYQKCLPWKDAVHCEEFPLDDGTTVLQLINSGNKCRNPSANMMLQPWCYVFINNTMCIRRYCDACNNLDPEDKFADCDSKIAADSTFCTDNLARFGCFKSCRMTHPAYSKDDVKCNAPVIPPEIDTSDSLSDSYNVGDKVSVSCNGQSSEIECTTLGWTPFSDECIASCIDASQMCQSTLELYPSFCQDPRYSEIANKLCKKSCGQCGGDAKCSSPVSDTVTRISESDSVVPGEVMTFACNDGLYLASGDVDRACSTSGELLGTAATCQDVPLPADVNLMGIRKRRTSVNSKFAMLMDGPAWHVPINGFITKWYYYCKRPEPIGLLVYRRTSESSKFQLVGYNEAECVLDSPWTFNVPSDQQIEVEAGDLIGVYNYRSTVASYSCSGSKEKPLIVRKAKVSKLSTLVSKPEYTFQNTCMHISLGAHVEPSV